MVAKKTKAPTKDFPGGGAAKKTYIATASGGGKGAESAGRKTTILRWLFAPDMAQGWKGWLLRSAGFAAAFFAFIIAVGIIGIKAQLVLAGLPVVPASVALSVLWDSVVQNIGQWIVAFSAVYAVGMFAMMPRRALDRRGFVALLFFFLFWMALAGAAAWTMNEYAVEIGLILWPLAALILAAIIGLFGAIVGYARAVGASRWQSLLAFPFGLALFEYAALFTKAAEGNNSIALKSKWFLRLRDFLLDDIRGQIVLAALIVLMAVFGSAWELFLITFFSVIYFWRGAAFIAANLPRLAWVAVAFNIAVVGFIAWMFGRAAFL